MQQDIEITRRTMLAGAVGGVAVFAASTPGTPAVAVPAGRDRARFLGKAELRTLRAVVTGWFPGATRTRSRARSPRAATTPCHHAIDALLGAFTVSPPRIYAGGPFSDRGGARNNDFADFLPLDRYETRAWRVRIEGSRGRRRLERNGRVKGYQRTYRRGLAELEASVPCSPRRRPLFATLRCVTRATPAIAALMDLVVTHTLEFMYGAPEYGGNRAFSAGPPRTSTATSSSAAGPVSRSRIL